MNKNQDAQKSAVGRLLSGSHDREPIKPKGRLNFVLDKDLQIKFTAYCKMTYTDISKELVGYVKKTVEEHEKEIDEFIKKYRNKL